MDEWSNLALSQLSLEWQVSQAVENFAVTWLGFVVAWKSLKWHEPQAVDIVWNWLLAAPL